MNHEPRRPSSLIGLACATTIIAGALISEASHAGDHPGFTTGDMLHEWCQAPKSDTGRYTACGSYITGVMEGAMVQQSRDVKVAGMADNIHCPPPGTNYAKMIEIVKGYLMVNYQDRDGIASHYVLEAWHDAWPCDKPFKGL